MTEWRKCRMKHGTLLEIYGKENWLLDYLYFCWYLYWLLTVLPSTNSNLFLLETTHHLKVKINFLKLIFIFIKNLIHCKHILFFKLWTKMVKKNFRKLCWITGRTSAAVSGHGCTSTKGLRRQQQGLQDTRS